MPAINRKLRGFTLAETLVSLVIILSVFAVGMLIMLNILKSDSRVQTLRARSILNEVYINTIKSGNYHDDDIHSEDLMVIKNFQQYGNSERILLMVISIEDSKGKRVLEHREVIIKGDDADW